MSDAALWTPPRLDGVPGTIELWNALLSYTNRPLPLADGVSARAALAEAPPADAFCIGLRVADGPDFVARPVAFPFAAAFGAEITVEDLSLLPPALRDALSTGLVTLVSAALPPPERDAVAVSRTGPLHDLLPAVDGTVPAANGTVPAADGTAHWFRVVLDGLAPGPVVVDLGASPAALAAIFDGSRPARPLRPALKEALTREAAVTLGRLTLPLAELRRLTPGAVVILEAGIEAGARLRTAEALFHFVPDAQGWLCAAVEAAAHPRPTGSPMDTSLVPRPDPGLDVALDLDIGRLTVSLAQIETWQVGSLVALEPARPEPGVEVAMRANGQLVGTGELVRVDDRLAVRITRLSL